MCNCNSVQHNEILCKQNTNIKYIQACEPFKIGWLSTKIGIHAIHLYIYKMYSICLKLPYWNANI